MTSRRLLALALALALSATARAADDPKLPDAKAFDKLVIDSLREVHNKGADLYNTKKEFVAAYRLYQGALEAVRPLLTHRPDAQKLIDTGLAAADKETDDARKAFVLHDTIEAVRKYLKTAIGAPKPADPPGKPDDKKPKDPQGTVVSGKITLDGKPLAGGEVTFTLVDASKLKTVKAKTADDGTYKLPEALPPGKYAITVTGTGVPAKYKTAETSGLVVAVKGEAHTHDIDLK